MQQINSTHNIYSFIPSWKRASQGPPQLLSKNPETDLLSRHRARINLATRAFGDILCREPITP